MKQFRNILVTCAGGAGTLDLVRKLRDSFHIFLADGNDQVAARYCSDLPFRKIPFGADPAFKQTMHDLSEEWKIDCIVPGADEELLPLASLREESGVACVLPERQFIETCLNKKALMEVLQKKNISGLLPFLKEEDVHFPAIAKPVRGRGSRQVHRLETDAQLKGYLGVYGKTFSEVLIQPYVDGEEYTISVIVNNRNCLLGIVPKRIIEKRGITRVAVSENSPLITKVCTRIVEELHPCGPFNVQLKIHNGMCFIFEINPRLSTTAILTEKAFGNEIELYIRYYDRESCAPLPTLRGGVIMLRHETHCFVDQE